jgi:uridine phosphorylase
MPVRLSPITDPAARAILTGDPRRAFALARALIGEPRMSHLARGLWAYSGTTAGGLEITVHATGVGGPGAATVIADLAGLGVETVVRLGTCVATGPGPEAGQAFLVGEALARDGVSNLLSGGSGSVAADEPLTDALAGVAPPGRVVSRDLTPALDPDDGASLGAELRDLQTAATFAVARHLGVAAAAVLLVAEDASGARLDETGIEEAIEPAGRRVVSVLEGLYNPQVEG